MFCGCYQVELAAAKADAKLLSDEEQGMSGNEASSGQHDDNLNAESVLSGKRERRERRHRKEKPWPATNLQPEPLPNLLVNSKQEIRERVSVADYKKVQPANVDVVDHVASDRFPSFIRQSHAFRGPKSRFRELTKKQKIHEFYAAPVTKFWAHAVSILILVYGCDNQEFSFLFLSKRLRSLFQETQIVTPLKLLLTLFGHNSCRLFPQYQGYFSRFSSLLLLILLGAFLAFSTLRCWFRRADANTARSTSVGLVIASKGEHGF
jgi:hypothetical protein